MSLCSDMSLPDIYSHAMYSDFNIHNLTYGCVYLYLLPQYRPALISHSRTFDAVNILSEGNEFVLYKIFGLVELCPKNVFKILSATMKIFCVFECGWEGVAK